MQTFHSFRLGLLVALVIVAMAATPAPARADKITDLTIKIKTTDQNREGGVVTVTLWQEDRIIASYVDSEKAWGDGTEVKISAENLYKNRQFNPSKPIEARINLSEANEVNILWRFNITVIGFSDTGNRVTISRDSMQLDTTGKGKNREAEALIGNGKPEKKEDKARIGVGAIDG